MKVMHSQCRSLFLVITLLALPLSSLALSQNAKKSLSKIKLLKSLSSDQIEQMHTTINSVVDQVTGGKLTVDIQSAMAPQSRGMLYPEAQDALNDGILKIAVKLYSLESAKFFKDVKFKDNVTFKKNAKFKENVTTNGTLSAADATIGCELTVGCNIDLNNSTNATIGNITKNSTPFIHNFGGDNTFIGIDAGNFLMTGFGNSSLGAFTLRSNESGVFNVATGLAALASNANGSINTAHGALTLISNTTGSANTAVGFISMALNTSGNDNTALGIAALASNITGNANTAIGAGALDANVIGSGNIAIGENAGTLLISGDNNIYIANDGVPSESGIIRIGTRENHFVSFIQGIYGVTSAASVPVFVNLDGQLGTVVSSNRFKHDVRDMDTQSANIYKLRPVTFVYNNDALETQQFGLIAEQVAEVLPAIVINDEDGQPYTVQYQVLPVLLLNEVQKQQKELHMQQASIKALMARIAHLEENAHAA
jgi:hypothetical protein